MIKNFDIQPRPDFQKAKPGHNLFSKKMLIVMLSNFKFVSITYRQNIQNT